MKIHDSPEHVTPECAEDERTLDAPEARWADHFESAYSLRPNDAYEANEYHYQTDRFGRISRCEGSLRLEDGKRNTAHQTRAGGEDRLEGDQGGHLIGFRFNGSEKIDNIVPMDGRLNQGEYKQLENEWAAELKKGNTVDVTIRCVYRDDSARPSFFVVKYTVTDENGFAHREMRRLSNEPQGRKGVTP